MKASFNIYYIFRKTTVIILYLLIFLLFVELPQINRSEYIQSTVISKFLFFAYTCLAVLGIYTIYRILSKKKFLSISKIDLALLILVSHISLNRYIFHVESSFSIRYLELIGLGFLYIVLRSLSIKSLPWFLSTIVLSGIIQAIYGNLQLLGYFPSNHAGFKMTGSFFNPGPYAGFLVCVWVISMGMYLFKDKIIISVKSQFKGPSTFVNFFIDIVFNYIPLLGIASILILLPSLRSRTAWLAAIIAGSMLFEIRYGVLKKLFKSFNKFKKAILITGSICIISASLIGIYYFKKDSSDGRMLIWNVTADIIKDKPILGVGFDQFKVHYMNFQAKYFSENIDSSNSMLADNNIYAFNDWLQFVTENGFIGFLLLFLVCFLLYSHKAEMKDKVISSILKISLISIGIVACFSYPMQILPIKLIIIFLLAHMASIDSNKFRVKAFYYSSGKKLIWLGNSVMLFAAIIGIKFGFEYTQKLDQGHKIWKDALSKYQYGDYTGAIQSFETSLPIFNSEGAFLMNYGKALLMAEQYKPALRILNQSKNYLNNTFIQINLGDGYMALKQYSNAESAYQKAAYMIPSRFYPIYLLAKLYNESNQKRKAKVKALEFLEKEVKIPSTAIKEMKIEMKKIIKDYKTEKNL